MNGTYVTLAVTPAEEIEVEEEEELPYECERCHSSCEQVHTVVTSFSWRSIDSADWCEDCVDHDAFCCDCCQKAVSTVMDNRLADGGSICQKCYEIYYFTCNGCDNIVPNDQRIDRNDGLYCENCDPGEERDEFDEHAVIHEYHSVDVGAHFGFQGNAPDGIYYGVELEVYTNGSRMSVAESVKRKIGYFTVNMEDGSLPRGGFEIISAPATLGFHHNNWDSLFDESLLVNEQCGMHVHVSRAPLSAITLARIVLFINADDNRSFIETIAGRSEGTFTAFRDKRIIDGQLSPRYSDRYEAVNYAGDNTIEFRIFASTVDRSRFFSNLEFVAAVVGWAKSSTQVNTSVDNFIDWLSDEIEYPHLRAFLLAKGLLTSQLALVAA